MKKNKIIAYLIIAFVAVFFFPKAFFQIGEHSNTYSLLMFLGTLFGSLLSLFVYHTEKS